MRLPTQSPFWLAGLLALAVAAPVTAQAADAPAADAPAAAQSEAGHDLDKIVCKKISETGTRLGTKKTCLSKREWAELARQARLTAERQGRPKKIGE